MIKKIIFTLLFVASLQTQAQEKTDTTTSNWKKTGNVSFLVNQSSFSNWIAGGESTIAGNLGVNYDFNYAKGNTTWDNKIIFAYGLNNVKGNETKKTDDRFEFNSLYGKKQKETGLILLL